MSRRTRVSSRRSRTKKRAFVSKAEAHDNYHVTNPPVNQVLNLPSTAGNQEVHRLFEAGVIQPKLKIGEPGDKYELEADRMAEQVMRMPDSVCPTCTEKKEESIQPKGENSATMEMSPDVESGIKSLKSGGQPLSESARNYFEPRFGYDFSAVRIHTGSEANEATKSINARAFTIGNDIVFARNNYSSKTEEGKKLLAHELTHNIQQMGKDYESDGYLQRAVDKDEDLQAELFAGDPLLEAVHDGYYILRKWEAPRGESVRKIQLGLQQIYSDALPIYGADGIFGPETEAEVKRFQRDSRLGHNECDGIIGAVTMGLIDDRIAGQEPKSNGLTAEDVADPRIDSNAQAALIRMSRKDSIQSEAAYGLLNSVKHGELAWIIGEYQATMFIDPWISSDWAELPETWQDGVLAGGVDFQNTSISAVFREIVRFKDDQLDQALSKDWYMFTGFFPLPPCPYTEISSESANPTMGYKRDPKDKRTAIICTQGLPHNKPPIVEVTGPDCTQKKYNKEFRSQMGLAFRHQEPRVDDRGGTAGKEVMFRTDRGQGHVWEAQGDVHVAPYTLSDVRLWEHGIIQTVDNWIIEAKYQKSGRARRTASKARDCNPSNVTPPWSGMFSVRWQGNTPIVNNNGAPDVIGKLVGYLDSPQMPFPKKHPTLNSDISEITFTGKAHLWHIVKPRYYDLSINNLVFLSYARIGLDIGSVRCGTDVWVGYIKGGNGIEQNPICGKGPTNPILTNPIAIDLLNTLQVL
jgi:hypothetical protein